MTRKTVLEKQEALDYSLKQLEIVKRNLEMCKRDVEKSQNEFRKAEVDYVLDSLLTWNRSGKLESRDIDLYLTHCINCLHGNIDGTVLNMKKEEKDGTD